MNTLRTMLRKLRRQWLGACLALIPAVVAAAPSALPSKAAIASAHPLATAAGREVMEAGGNAFDAAIAVAAALAVVEPYSSGIGGGGFFLLHRASDGKDVMLDARETAPGAATRDIYLDANGEVIPGLSLDGARAAAIPGLPAGLAALATHDARLSLARDLAPAIRLARDGFAVTPRYLAMAKVREAALRKDPTSAQLFLGGDALPAVGQVLRQPDLARTLEALAAHGHEGFYRGAVAAKLVAGVRAAGGLWTEEDLASYRVAQREPLVGEYHGIRVVSAPPPSSGGVALLETLNLLAPYDLGRLDRVQRTHVIVEAMRRAYRDRAEYLGDPDFVQVPIEKLLNPRYAAYTGMDIHLDRATPSRALKPIAPPPQGDHTTHLSVLDVQGNRVAATLSINYPFGSAFTPPGTGVLLNDEMDDFSAKPFAPNGYGLVGTEANAIAPHKRPLSSMTPTFLEHADRVAILGTPGGSRIISMVLLGVLAYADGLPVDAWVATPRFHHQYLPDEIQHEARTFDDATRAGLTALGHTLKQVDRDYGNMQAILWRRGEGDVSAAADPRGEGSADVFVPAATGGNAR